MVCHKANSSYTCPACASRYCCAACCKTHKETCKPIEKQSRKQPVIDPVLSSSVNEDIRVLSESQKAALLKSSTLNTLLKSKRLRHQLRCLDQCEKRQERLKELRNNNEDIRKFVDDLLKVVNSV